MARVSRRVPKANVADPAALRRVQIYAAARTNLEVDVFDGVVDKPKEAFEAFLLAHGLNRYYRNNKDAVRMLVQKQVIKL